MPDNPLIVTSLILRRGHIARAEGGLAFADGEELLAVTAFGPAVECVTGRAGPNVRINEVASLNSETVPGDPNKIRVPMNMMNTSTTIFRNTLFCHQLFERRDLVPQSFPVSESDHIIQESFTERMNY